MTGSPELGRWPGLGRPRGVFDSWIRPLQTPRQGLRPQRRGELQEPEGGWGPGADQTMGGGDREVRMATWSLERRSLCPRSSRWLGRRRGPWAPWLCLPGTVESSDHSLPQWGCRQGRVSSDASELGNKTCPELTPCRPHKS